jgi:hypothetical protein
MYRGDIKMIKNTEVQYTRREAKLIAEILDAARSEFYKDKDERSGSFKYFSDSDIESRTSALSQFVLHEQGDQSGARHSPRAMKTNHRPKPKSLDTVGAFFCLCQ